jgi:hypothetical protein
MYRMYLHWWQEPKTLGEFAGEVQGYVRAIEPIDEAFSKLSFAGRRSKSVHAFAQDADLVPRLIAESSLFERRYPFYGLDAAGKPLPSSTSRWDLILQWHPPGRQSVHFFLADGKTDLAAYPAKFMVDFAESRFPQATVDLLFLETVRYWRPAIACLTSDDLREAAGTVSYAPTPEAGWRTYVGWKGAIEAPQGATVERVPPGGSLITLPGEHPDAGNPQQVDALRALHRSLSSRTIGFIRLKRRIPGNSRVYGRGLSSR